MPWIDGKMILAEDKIIFQFDENEPVEYKSGDWNHFNVEIRDPETGELDDISQWLEYGAEGPALSPYMREPKMVWKLVICTTKKRNRDSYQNMRKRLILTWDRIMMPEVDRDCLVAIAKDHQETNGWGSPVISYRQPTVDV